MGEIFPSSAAHEVVRLESIIKFIEGEIAEMREIEKVRRDRSATRVFTPRMKYRMFTTRQQIINDMGIGRLKTVWYLTERIQANLDTNDFSYWIEGVNRAEDLEKAMYEILESVERNERPKSVASYANPIHIHTMQALYNLRIFLGKRKMLKRWLELSRSRPATTVMKKIRKIAQLVSELECYSYEFIPEHIELISALRDQLEELISGGEEPTGSSEE